LTGHAAFRLTFDATGGARAAAFALEASIFDRTYGVSLADHVAEFAPYASASHFVTVHDRQDEVVGVMRLITPGPAGLKTLVEAGGEPWRIDGLRAARAAGVDPDHTWDVATLGVARGVGRYRPVITAALYHALAVSAPRNGVTSLLMTVDERVRSILQLSGLYTTALPGAKPGPFCGSPASTPVYGHCAQMFGQWRRTNPDAYRLIGLGIGLDDITLPPRDQFVLGAAQAQRPVPITGRPSAPFRAVIGASSAGVAASV
jgi:hypothetical protein